MDYENRQVPRWDSIAQIRRKVTRAAAWGLTALLCLVCAAPAFSAIAYVQGADQDPSSASSVSVTYASAQTAGDLNVVVLTWGTSTATITSITDTKGNAYTEAVSTSAYGQTLVTYYAKNISAAAAGANTVTVTFSTSVHAPDVFALEYSGISTTNPLDVEGGSSGVGTTTSSGQVTTTNANDVLVAGVWYQDGFSAVGTGYTKRIVSDPDVNLVEDEVVTSAGNYTATSTQPSASEWVMQVAAFRAASGDSTPPTNPSNLTATASSSSQIALSWTASTDNVGVTGYYVERCTGSGCSNFTQIASVSGSTTTYTDSGLSASTSYSYRVRATDAAGNLSGYSNTASATTSSGGAGTGLIGYWKFDEGMGTTTADSSGNGNTGTLVNSPTWTAGETNEGLAFNGSNQSVAVSDTGGLDNLYAGGMTVAAWIYVNGSSSTGRIIDKDNNNIGWFFAMNNTTEVKFQVDQFPTSEPSRTSTATVPTNTWVHVAATWDGGTSGANIHIYINGQLADGTEGDGSGTAGSDVGVPFTIGNRPVDNARPFKGTIDEVRVYNRVLSASEIAAIYSGSGDTQPPTAPSNLSANPATSSEIDLTWTGSTDNVGVTGYLIERCENSGCSNFSQIGSVTGTSYNDTGLSASTTYSYRVRATDAAGNLSGYSNSATTTTSGGSSDTQPPTTPGTLQVVAASSSEVDLIWTASSDNVGVTAYYIERCSGASCANFTQIAASNGNSYNDASLAAGTSYSYRVRATDAAGNLSSYSATTNVSTPSASADCN